MKTLLYLSYSYLISPIIALLFTGAIWQLGFLPDSTKFLESTAPYCLAFFGFLFAGSLAARLILFNLNGTDFGAWLEWKKAGGIYAGAFLFNSSNLLISVILSLLLIYFKHKYFSLICLIIFLSGVINSSIFMVSIYHLTRLQALFNLEHRKILESEKKKLNRPNS